MKKSVIISGILILVLIGVAYVAFSGKPQYQDLGQPPRIPAITGGAPTSTPTSTGSVFTMMDVASHGSQSSCYTAIRGSVYDLTSFIEKHPGGAENIISICGKDGTKAFESQHGGRQKMESMLNSFKIGTLRA